MADNEIKIVHRGEAFNDHAFEELADTRAQCVCRLQYGRYSLNCAAFMSHKQFMSLNKKVFLVFFLLVAALVGLCVAGNAVEYKEFFTEADKRNAPKPKVKAKHEDISKETEINVRRVLRMVNERVYDMNGDGKVNCIDHAVMFKLTWDEYFPDADCVIVRNMNPNSGMSHLFVAVFESKLFKYVDIEPWSRNIDVWQMADVWGNAYDKWYNIYGEDDAWMSMAGVR